MKKLEPNSILFNNRCLFSYIGGEGEARKEVQYSGLNQGGKKLFTQFIEKLGNGEVYKYDYYAKGIAHFSGLCIFQNNRPVYEFSYDDKETKYGEFYADDTNSTDAGSSDEEKHPKQEDPKSQ